MRDWLAKKILAAWKREPSVFRDEEANGSALTVVSLGDTFEVYQGKKRIHAFEVSTRVMLRLSSWVFWHFFVFGTWFGFKLRLRRWAMFRVNRLEGDRDPESSATRRLAGPRG